MRTVPVLALAIVAACGPAPQRAAPPAATGARGGALRTAQQQLRGAVHLQQRRELVDRLKTRSPEIAPQILAALKDPAGEGFEAAAELAAEVQLDAAFEPLLAALAPGSGPHRAAALRAANAIRSLSTADLVGWLEDADADLQLQTLFALDGRGDVPFAPLVPLLEGSSPVLARAAAHVLPDEPSAEQGRALAGLDFRSEGAAAAVIEELGKRQLPDGVMSVWLERLRQQVPSVQCAILGILRSRQEALGARGLLMDLVVRDGDPLVRFEALHCLVAARAAEPDWLLARSKELPRQYRLLCALGLLTQHRDEGARLLYELAFGAEPQPVAGDAPAPDLEPVTAMARTILSQAAGLPLHQGQQAFAAWTEHPKVARPECLTFAGSAAAWFPAPAPAVPPDLAAPPR